MVHLHVGNSVSIHWFMANRDGCLEVQHKGVFRSNGNAVVLVAENVTTLDRLAFFISICTKKHLFTFELDKESTERDRKGFAFNITMQTAAIEDGPNIERRVKHVHSGILVVVQPLFISSTLGEVKAMSILEKLHCILSCFTLHLISEIQDIAVELVPMFVLGGLSCRQHVVTNKGNDGV